MAVGTAVLLGSTVIAAAKSDHNFRNDSHRFEHGSSFHKEDDHHAGGKHDRHDGDHNYPSYREPDQIEAFQNFWRRTGYFAMSCTKYAWNTVFHWDRFHHGKHPRPHHDYTPPDHTRPVSPAGGPDDGYTPPDQGKPEGPQIADRSDKPDWYEPEPDRPIPIPEPGSLGILGSALLTGWLLRRRNKTS